MTLYLLDTNICIGFLRGNSPEIRARMKHSSPGDLAISTITLAELRHGADRSSDPRHNHESTSRLAGSLSILPFDVSAAETYGAIRASLERAGTPIGPLDTLIAAQAMALDLTLVTANEREFRRVAGLKVVNWSKK